MTNAHLSWDMIHIIPYLKAQLKVNFSLNAPKPLKSTHSVFAYVQSNGDKQQKTAGNTLQRPSETIDSTYMHRKREILAN